METEPVKLVRDKSNSSTLDRNSKSVSLLQPYKHNFLTSWKIDTDPVKLAQDKSSIFPSDKNDSKSRGSIFFLIVNVRNRPQFLINPFSFVIVKEFKREQIRRLNS